MNSIFYKKNYIRYRRGKVRIIKFEAKLTILLPIKINNSSCDSDHRVNIIYYYFDKKRKKTTRTWMQPTNVKLCQEYISTTLIMSMNEYCSKEIESLNESIM